MTGQSKPYATARSAAGLVLLSCVSPIAGLAVEMAMAYRFGTSAAVDGFRVALTVVFIGQSFFINSLFPNITVPLFAEYRARGEERAAWRAALSFANLTLVPTVFLAASLFIWPGHASRLLAPGLAGEAHRWAAFFVRWLGLALVPLLYAGAGVGLLYACRVFWTPSAAQFVYNIALAVVIVVFAKGLGPAALAVGILLGAALFAIFQIARLLPFLLRSRIPGADPRDKARSAVRTSIRMSIPLFGGVLVGQAQNAVVNWSLSADAVGTIAALGYAFKLTRLGILLPDVMATVLFPRLADAAQAPSRAELRGLATRALRMALFIALPIVCTLFGLRRPLVSLVYAHGAFSSAAALRVARIFGILLLMLPASVASTYLMRVLYVLQDMWWPTHARLVNLAIVVLAIPWAAAHFSAEGVGFVLVGTGWIATGIQVAVLRRKYDAIASRELGAFLLRIAPVAIASAGLGVVAAGAAGVLLKPGIAGLLLAVGGGGAAAIGSYWLAAMLIGVPEALECNRYLQWQSQPVLKRIWGLARG